MTEEVKMFCRNNGQTVNVPMGATLEQVYPLTGLQMQHGPVLAHVNNKVEGMHYRLYNPREVEFLDITSSSGLRAYTRSLFFVLCKAVHDLYDESTVSIDIPVSNGYYVDLQIGHPVTLDDAGRIRRRMQEIVDAGLPIHRHETTTEEAIRLFEERHTYSKVKLLKSIGRIYTTYYEIDDYVDYYYGALLTNTSQLYLFGLEKYYDGLLLRPLTDIERENLIAKYTRALEYLNMFVSADGLPYDFSPFELMMNAHNAKSMLEEWLIETYELEEYHEEGMEEYMDLPF